MSDYIDGDALVGDTDPELVPIKIVDKGTSGFAIVGEPGPELFDIPPGSSIYPNVTNLHPNGPTTINFMVNGVQVDNTSFTVVNPFNSVCSGGGFLPFSYQHVLSLSPPHDYMEIVRVVAETDSTCYNDNGPDLGCPFCNGYQTEHSRIHDEPFPHDQDCIVLKARAMVQAMPYVEAKK